MIILDYRDTRPLYEQIVDKFQMLILSGALEPNSRMPSVRSLAVELSINPNTIQKAYSILEQNGYIYPVKGRGNFVSGNEKLKLRKQESVYASLRENVKKGQELGISCEKMTEKVQEYYREEKKQE